MAEALHNMRASLETDLMADHPIHVVCKWVGNTPKVALGHYLQTLDSDFDKATRGGAESGAVAGRVVQNPVQTWAVRTGPNRTDSPQPPLPQGVLSGVGVGGLPRSGCADSPKTTRTPGCSPTGAAGTAPPAAPGSTGRPPGRKTVQLAGQVRELVSGLLASSADDDLRSLEVVSVTPAPDSSRMLVVRGDGDAATTEARLLAAAGWLRVGVAEGVTRRRVPGLAFAVT